MDILGYEIDIYAVIAVTAGIFVFGIIYLMSSGFRKKKPVVSKRKLKASTNVVRQNGEIAAGAELAKEAQPKLAQRPQLASPMKPSEAQVAVAEEKSKESSSLLPLNATEAAQQEQSAEMSEVKTKSAVSPIMNAITADSVPAEMKGAYQEQEAPALNQVQKSEIAQLSEEKQEDENDDGDSLSDIFSIDEEEDSDVANLAADLEDIDLSSLKKMSEELSQILGGRNPGISRR